LLASPNIIGLLISRKLVRAGHLAWLCDKRSFYGVLVEKSKGQRLMEINSLMGDGSV
jgi:hypothetical protein